MIYIYTKQHIGNSKVERYVGVAILVSEISRVKVQGQINQ
jgi:hypothetical protein